MKYRPSADECAVLLGAALRRHAEEAGKEITRARFTEKSMRRICGRRMLRGAFLDDLATAMLDREFVLMQGSRYYGVLKETSLEGWTRVTSTPIAEELGLVRDGNDIERRDALNQLEDILDGDAVEDDE